MRDLLRRLLLDHIDELQVDDICSFVYIPQQRDLDARSYLRFASREIDACMSAERPDESLLHRINCITHLKRALMAEVDEFLCCLGLDTAISRRNLGTDKKLGILQRIGLLSSRTVARFVSVRNRVEHEYAKPEFSPPELEVYADLITAIVATLRVTAREFPDHVYLKVADDDWELDYHHEEARAALSRWQDSSYVDCPGGYVTVAGCGVDDYDNLLFALRALFALKHFDVENPCSRENFVADLAEG